MKRLALFTFAFTWLAACDSPSAPTLQRPTLATTPPSFAKLFNGSFDISGTLFNPCPPTEVVAFQGSIHEVVTGDFTPTGSNLKFHFNTQGIEGVGLTSGDRYRVIENDKETDVSSFVPPFPFSFEFDDRFRMIRQGSADNLWFRQTVRVSFPPFNVEIIRNELECRG